MGGKLGWDSVVNHSLKFSCGVSELNSCGGGGGGDKECANNDWMHVRDVRTFTHKCVCVCVRVCVRVCVCVCVCVCACACVYAEC